MENSCKKTLIVLLIINVLLVLLIFLLKKWFFFLPVKFNGLILLYCLTYMSFSRVSGAYEYKMHKGKVLDFEKVTLGIIY